MTRKAARVHLVLLATAAVIAVIGLSKDRSASERDSEGAERAGGTAVSQHRPRGIPEDDISRLPPRSPRHAAGEFQKDKLRLERERQELEANKVELQTRQSMLLRLEGDQLYAYAAGIELPDNLVRIAFPKLLDSRRNLEAFKLAGLGTKHPAMEAEMGQIGDLTLQLAAGVAEIRAITTAQLELVSDRLDRKRPPRREIPD